MKNVARMALVPGMEIAADVCNRRNEVVIPAGTKVDNSGYIFIMKSQVR